MSTHVEIEVPEAEEYPQYEMLLPKLTYRFMGPKAIRVEARKQAGMSRLLSGRFVIDAQGSEQRPMQQVDREQVAEIIYHALPAQHDI